MRARADAYFAPDGADFGQAATVRANTLVEDARAYDVPVCFFKGFFYLTSLVFVLTGEFGDDLGLQVVNCSCCARF